MASASSIAASIASKTKTKKKHFVAQKVKLFRASDPLLSVVMWGVNHSVSHLFSCLYGDTGGKVNVPFVLLMSHLICSSLSPSGLIDKREMAAVQLLTIEPPVMVYDACAEAVHHITHVLLFTTFLHVFCIALVVGSGRERERERGVSALNSSLASCCAHVG